MQNISGFGLSLVIVALQTFPLGIKVSAFPDDVDPLIVEDNESTKIEMLYDGTLFAYDTSNPILVSVSVIPYSDDDINLRILLSTRKTGIKWLPIDDVTSMVINYPDGDRVVYSGGSIVSGPTSDSVTQNGRRKTNTYKFAFGSVSTLQAKQITADAINAALGLL